MSRSAGWTTVVFITGILMTGVLHAQIPGQAPIQRDDINLVNDEGSLLDAEDVDRTAGISDETGNVVQPHPLGLLPNPVIRTDTRYTYEDLIWRKPDTTILGFHEYNPVSKWRYPYLYLGVVGQNYRSLLFDPSWTVGKTTGHDAFGKYWYRPDDVRYFNTKVPYTSLYYNLGKNVENNAHVVHAQNIGPYFNASFDYRLLNMQGAYTHQKTLMHNLYVNSWFNSKNHRYSLMFAFLFNRMEDFENGGIDFNDLFTKENAGTARALVPVWLEEAVNTSNNKGLYLKQRQFLGPERTVKTSDTTEMELVERHSALSYTFHYDRWNHKYTDEQSDTSYYDQFFFDSTMTGDSTFYWKVRLGLRWENTSDYYIDSGQVTQPVRYFAAIDYDHTKYRNFGIRQTWDNLIFSGGINTNPLIDRKWHFGVSASLNAGPAAAGDYAINGFARWQINDMMYLRAFVETGRSTPGQRILAYQSNHFTWINDFDPVLHQKVSLLFRCDHGDIDGELTWRNVQHFVYMDQNRDFQQASSNLNVLVFRGSKAFDWKNFYLYNGISAQFISDRGLLRLPKFYLKQRFHYQGGFFSGKLTAHLGFDITYYTNYYANAYNPATRDFYLQDVEKFKFYPVLDLYFEIFIKRARLFFLMQHVNQGMFGQKGYYVAPDYPAQDRAFKAGVSWKFYD